MYLIQEEENTNNKQTSNNNEAPRISTLVELGFVGC